MTGLRPLSRTRLHLEHLEGRALPSGFGSLVPVSAVSQVVTDIQHIRSDVQSLTRIVGSASSSQLAKIQGDVTTLVKDAVSGSASAVAADLKTLSGDESALLGSLGSAARTRVNSIFRALQKDFNALNTDLTRLTMTGRDHDRGDGDDRHGDDRHGDDRDEHGGVNLGQTGTVIRDLLSVRQDLQSLTNTLGSHITDTVKNDITAVRTAIGSVIGDLLNGTSVTQDLINLKSAVTTLTTDIGAGAATQGILTRLTNDVTKLTTDITALTTPTQAALSRVQSDLTSLTSSLGSNLSPALQADEAALTAAINALAADVAAGKSITSDLGNALTSEFNLLRDLPSPLAAGTRQSLARLAADLVRLTPALNL